MPKVDAVRTRRQLDERFARLKIDAFAKPPVGWIRTIRHALGMSAADLGVRMGLTKARVLAIEQGEATETLNFDTLKRAADALGCTLVYAVIPKKPLEEAVRERALEIAAEHVSAVDQTMRLENQGIAQTANKQQLNEVADELVRRSPRSLWKRHSIR